MCRSKRKSLCIRVCSLTLVCIRFEADTLYNLQCADDDGWACGDLLKNLDVNSRLTLLQDSLYTLLRHFAV